MKKLLLRMTGTALLFGLVLAGCEQPTEFTNTVNEVLPSIPGPGNLKANSDYDGVVFLTWDAVTNANGYRIIRKDTETGEFKQLGDTGADIFFYSDTVGWTNQLVNDRDYEYTVISLNANGINRTVTGPVLSGESKVTVKPKVPARTAFPAITIAAADITPAKYTNASGDRLLVTLANTKPNLAYTVTYVYGKDQQIVQYLTGTSETNLGGGTLFASTKAVYFPLIGGDNTVTVKAEFIGGLDYYNNATKTQPKATGSLALSSLGNISGFSAVRVNNGVKFTWNDVPGATAYKIYKAALTSPSTTVTGDWVAVTFTGQSKTGNGDWEAFENFTTTAAVTAAAGEWQYVIIAENTTAKSNPAVVTLTQGSITVASMSIQLHSTDSTKVQVQWTTETNATYELSYIQAEAKNGNNAFDYSSDNYKLIGGYTTVTIPPAAYSQGRALVDVAPVKDKTYIFRLVTKKDGLEKVFYAELNQFPFTAYVNLDVSQNTWTTSDLVNSIRIDVRDNGSPNGTYSFQLYRRDTSNPSNVYASVGAKVNNWNFATSGIWSYLDTGLNQGKRYQYKVAVDTYKPASNSVTMETNTNLSPVQSSQAQITSPNGWNPANYHASAITINGVAYPARSLELDGSYIGGQTVTFTYSLAAGGTSTNSATIVQRGSSYYIVLPTNAATSGTINGNLSINNNSFGGSYY